jgi:DNA-binding response OmpR family regulator
MHQRILVVDDEEAVLFAVTQYFQQYGYQVDCARRTPDAKALLRAVDYQLLITDLRLTGDQSTEGFEIIRYARDRCPRARVVLMTAHGSPEIEREAQRLGADAILYKPVPLSEVAQVVFELLGSPS